MKKLLFFLVALLCSSAFAITGDEVVKLYFDKNPPPGTSNTLFEVVSYKKDGSVDTPSTGVQQYGRDIGNQTEATFCVVKGVSNKDTRLLQSKKPKINQAWVYLPSMRTIRRINQANGAKSFLGSEFSYNDTAIRYQEEDSHTLLEETVKIVANWKSYDCYKVKSVPISKNELEFDYRVQYFDQATLIPVKIEYYKKEKLIKIIESQELREIPTEDGKKRWTRWTTKATNQETGRYSILSIKDQKLEGKINEKVFSQQWLSTGK